VSNHQNTPGYEHVQSEARELVASLKRIDPSVEWSDLLARPARPGGA
jgi:hypothetical protein